MIKKDKEQIKKCKFCLEKFESKVKVAVFCSINCRVRYHSNKQKRSNKSIKCVDCGEKFKQSSTMQIICIDCREKRRWRLSEPKVDVIPVLDRQIELDMQSEWIKKNGVSS